MWYVRPLTEESLHFLHERVLEEDPKAEKGYTSKSLVGPCMERAIGDFYDKTQYEDIHERTAALIQGIINFHPFTDGNKRTALLTAYFFLNIHGYRLTLTKEKVLDKFIDIANEKTSDIKDIANWLKTNSKQRGIPFRLLSLYLRFRNERIDLVSMLGETGLVTLLLKTIGKVWPEK